MEQGAKEKLIIGCFLTSLSLSGFSQTTITDPGLKTVFDLEALPTLTIEVPLDQWNKLLLDYDRNPNNEEKVKANLTFVKAEKTVKLENIGFRLRGNLSRKRPEGAKNEPHNPKNPDWHHAHFKLDFKKFVKDQRLFGLRAMNLKFFNNDPTYVREIFSYHLLRQFGVWTAPFSSYARLYVRVGDAPRSVYFGVYQMVENIDKQFLAARFFPDQRKGDLWKCLYTKNGPADLVAQTINASKIGVENVFLNEERSFRPSYDLKTNKKDIKNAGMRFITFLNRLNSLEGDSFKIWIEDALDVDLFLRTVAVNALVGMWDGYCVNANNYYLYFTPTNRCYFIPYDYDNTMGTSFLLPNAGTHDVFHWGPMDQSRPLISKILKIPEYRRIYANHLRSLIDETNGLYTYEASTARIRKWHGLIHDHVDNDTGENTAIKDLPAPWAKAPYYRLFSGDHNGKAPEANFIKTRIHFAKEQLSDL